MKKCLSLFLLFFTGFTWGGLKGYATLHDPYVKVILINPVQYATPEAYLSPSAHIVADSLTLRPADTLALLSQMVDGEAPIIETGCFYPDLKLVYKNHTYILSTHCAAIYKFKNDVPYVSGNTRLANDFIFTESLILYFQRLKKVRLGNNSDKFFASLGIPSALSRFRKQHPAGDNSVKNVASTPQTTPPQPVIVPKYERPVAPVATVTPSITEKPQKPQSETITTVNPPKEKDEYEQLFNYPALIRKAVLYRPSGDTVLYTDKTDLKSYVYFTKQNIAFKPIVYTGTNEIRFDFDAPTNFKPLNFVFQWKLEGREDQWSDWSEQKSVILTGFSPRTYKFKVRAKDNKERISNEASFEFTVLPRWSLEGEGNEAPFAVVRRVLLRRASYDSVLYRNSLLLASSAEDVQLKKPLQLNYASHALRFEFSRPDGDGSKIYQYYMAGTESVWREWTAESHADYAYLAPGNYTFHLRLKQPNGQYSQEATIPIVVEKPWHESGLFYGSLLGGFLVLAGIALAGQPKEKWEGKTIAGAFFIGLAVVGEIISHQLHETHFFDPDMIGVLKIGVYASFGIALALLPFTHILDRIDPKYAKGLNKTPAT